jgi:hypothetical protein
LHPPSEHIKTIGAEEDFAGEHEARYAEDAVLVSLQGLCRQRRSIPPSAPRTMALVSVPPT